jgi:hypothetical protein
MGLWRPPAAGSVSYLPDDRGNVFPYAFDLLELKGSDLRREPIAAERPRQPDGLRGSITIIATRAPTSRPASTQESHLRNIQNEHLSHGLK